ncbi:MAG: C2H2-type zinc finger protein [Candidatus Nitrosocosmicus sp.]|nr:C2H2-type zinc finger protein [Candidatus Nitrosocosmicus sp.]
MSTKDSSKVPRFVDLINESVHTSDDNDIGDIEAVNNNFIVIKRGFVNVHYYYIPISLVEGWDGKVLWIKINEAEVEKKYERKNEPDPYRYYVRDYPYYTPDYYPVSYNPILPIIPSRYFIPASYTSAKEKETSTPIQCDLCIKDFTTEDELSNHILKEHSETSI